jgi:uncharacterized protein
MDKKIVMFCLCALIAIFVIPSVIFAASFDCSKASTKTEKAICEDPILSKLDEDMAAAYSKALKTSDRDIVKKGQRKWLKETLTPCHEDKKCIKGAYENRIHELNPTAGDTMKNALPTAPVSQVSVQSGEIVSKTKPLECPQCGVWQLSSSEPDGLVGDNVFIDDHQIVIPGCGVFSYKVKQLKTTVEREDDYIYDVSLLLSPQTEISLLCKEGRGDTWTMDINIGTRGSADLVLSKDEAKNPTLSLVGWSIGRDDPCEYGTGEGTAVCLSIVERLTYRILSVKAEQAYKKLLESNPSKNLPNFNAARFSAVVSQFCENKEKDRGSPSWSYAWAYTCQNRILEAKLKEFSTWMDCMEKNKNKHGVCKFPAESFDRNPKSEADK